MYKQTNQAISISDGNILSKPLMVTYRTMAPKCYGTWSVLYEISLLQVRLALHRHRSLLCSATIMLHITSSMTSTLWWVSWLLSGDDSIKHIV